MQGVREYVRRPGPFAGLRAGAVVLFGLGLGGCATFHRPEGESLSGREEIFAQALAHYCQGLIYEQELGPSSPKALQEFRNAAAMDPSEHRLQAKVAQLALIQKRPEEAIAALETSRRIHPRLAQAQIDLATAFQFTGNLDKAIEHYRAAQRLEPTNAILALAIARLYLVQQKDAEAERALKRGIARAADPSPILAYCYTQGREFVRAGQTARSIRCFEVLARYATTQRQQFYNLLGELYESMGQDETAIHNFILATHENPPLPSSFVRVALLQLKQSPAKAVDTLVEADRILPNNPSILFPLGYLYSSQSDYAKAIETFDRVETILQGSTEQRLTERFYLLYGSVCERAGQKEKAEEIFEECIKMYPESDAVLNYLAYMWAEQGIKLEKALDYITRALKRDPRNGAYVDTLGWVYFQRKDYPKALEEILKAHELIKDDPTIVDHLGDAFQALGDKAKAAAYWKESFIIDPRNAGVAEKLRAAGVDLEPLRKEAQRRVEQAEANKGAPAKGSGPGAAPPEPAAPAAP